MSKHWIRSTTLLVCSSLFITFSHEKPNGTINLHQLHITILTHGINELLILHYYYSTYKHNYARFELLCTTLLLFIDFSFFDTPSEFNSSNFLCPYSVKMSMIITLVLIDTSNCALKCIYKCNCFFFNSKVQRNTQYKLVAKLLDFKTRHP